MKAPSPRFRLRSVPPRHPCPQRRPARGPTRSLAFLVVGLASLLAAARGAEPGSARGPGDADVRSVRAPDPRPFEAPRTRLGIDGAAFTLNGQPTFLLGASYYGALGASDDTWRRDLDALQERGVNWVRIWATWAAFGTNVAALAPDGGAREPFLDRLVRRVADADRRGMVVDVTLSRGNGVSGAPKLQTHDAHRRAVETLIEALRPWPNWYLDLSNERNIQDPRHTSFAELARLRARARALDPTRLVTASHAGDLTRDDVRAYVEQVRVDFLAPHRPRDARSPAATATQTREWLAWMAAAGRVVPVHHQEPFRRGYGRWEPAVADFLTDLRGARAGGAAGWCFHNGDRRAAPEGRPRRSFDLREQTLFEQLDAVELEVLARLRPAPGD